MMEEQKSEYQAKSEGRLLGVLQWPDFEALWAHLKANPDGWYVWDRTSPPPDLVLSAPEFSDFLIDSATFIRARHKADYFGVIYADNPAAPSFLNLFDPRHMGSACTISGKPIDPRWTVSRIRPEIPLAPAPAKSGFMRLFQRA